MNKHKTVMITGSSGFIGFHLCKKFLESGYKIIGIDNENAYYDPGLKRKRRKILTQYPNFHFIKCDIRDKASLQKCFESHHNIECIYHLAAQAGVAYNQNHPQECIENNIIGFIHLIQEAEKNNIKKIIYASSSSVYGNSPHMSEEHKTEKMISLYAISKKCNELIAEMYTLTTDISFIGTRFFSVYGPRGRPDMAYFKFIQALFANQAISIYGNGESKRDRTYIDDIIEGLYRLKEYPKEKHSIFNLGNQTTLSLNEILKIIEKQTNKKFLINYLPAQKYDAQITCACAQKAKTELNREAQTVFSTGIKKFIQRYQEDANFQSKVTTCLK